MNIQPRNRILASLLVIIIIASLSIAATVSADHLGKTHRIGLREAMVVMGEYAYDQPLTFDYRDAMVLPDGFEYSLPDSYSNIPLHGSIWLSSEYQQPIINTLIH